MSLLAEGPPSEEAGSGPGWWGELGWGSDFRIRKGAWDRREGACVTCELCTLDAGSPLAKLD